MKQTRVLIVDDSATMRALIATRLSRDASIKVVGEAGDPYQARNAINELDPDVMTLDVEMPRMNGLDFLEKVMMFRPLPVVMISAMTPRGASAAIRAMEIGAVDCVGKPSIEHPDALDDLADKIRSAASARMVGRRVRPAPSQENRTEGSYTPDGKLVAIGASTGGVEALLEIIAQYPANCPATVVTLHMPAQFTRSFAQRLDRICAATVTEASSGAPLVAGRVYVAPGGSAHLEVAGKGQPHCRLRASEPVNGHCPSVDVLFSSVATLAGAAAVGVILTGMGRDGAEGLLAMRQAGARTLGQDEATCVVYGMPKVAFQRGAVEKQIALQQVTGEILALTESRTNRR